MNSWRLHLSGQTIRLLGLSLLALGLLGACATPGSGTASPVPFSRFIGPDDCPGSNAFADPYVFQHGDAWYLTSTYTVGQPMFMFRTADWRTKSRLPLSIDLNPEYLRSHFHNSGLVPQGLWGFVPVRYADGRWHAYGSVHVGNFNTFICHFQALTQEWPVTQWRLDKVLVGTPSSHTYETKVYADSTGDYLFYVDHLADGNNHIMVQKLRAPDEIDDSFAPYPVLSPEGLASEYRNGRAGMQICEGPNVVRLASSGTPVYALFYSVGDFARKNYKLGVAYSDSLVPAAGQQYLKPKAADPAGLWGNPGTPAEVVYLLQTETDRWPNFQASRIAGPGLGNLVRFRGNDYLVFHAHDAGLANGGGSGRWTWICPATVDLKKTMDEWIKPVPLDR